MAIFKPPKQTPPPAPAAPPSAPTPADSSVALSGNRQRMAARSMGATLLTGAQGLTEPARTSGKSLLGQ